MPLLTDDVVQCFKGNLFSNLSEGKERKERKEQQRELYNCGGVKECVPVRTGEAVLPKVIHQKMMHKRSCPKIAYVNKPPSFLMG